MVVALEYRPKLVHLNEVYLLLGYFSFEPKTIFEFAELSHKLYSLQIEVLYRGCYLSFFYYSSGCT